MWRRAFLSVLALGLVGLGAGTVLADPALNGTYKLSSRKQGSTFGPRTEVRIWVEEQAGGSSYRITRQEVYSNGRGAVLTGTGTPSSSGWIRVTFEPVTGLADLPVFNQPTTGDTYRGTYRVRGNAISGYFRGPDRNGALVSRYESGSKTTSEPVPSGQPTDPTPPPGGDLASLGAQVTKVAVVTEIDIKDAADVQFERALGAQQPSVNDPAAIIKGTPLTLRVTIGARQNPAANTRARLTGTAGSTTFSADVALSGLTSGQEVRVTSSAPLNAKVAINELDIAWKLNDTAIGSTKLRIYTTLRAPIHNIAWDRTETATKRHFENACRWANNASQNIGQGADSIPYQLDNQMRHYVHWEDLGNTVPAVPDYARNAAAPVNYKDLDGWVNNGVRSVSSLYYPPLEVSKPYEEYAHYRNNFGWNLLDNPTHVGGRCNQQASLVCAIAGTVGIKGEVLYLERTGRGKRTGRPVRNYFYAQGGGGPWNFHGVALLDLDNGTQWIYDGSFSSPPNRKNGTRDWAENAGGPFIGSWADWYYEDMGGKVPADDRPDHWEGVQ